MSALNHDGLASRAVWRLAIKGTKHTSENGTGATTPDSDGRRLSPPTPGASLTCSRIIDGALCSVGPQDPPQLQRANRLPNATCQSR